MLVWCNIVSRGLVFLQSPIRTECFICFMMNHKLRFEFLRILFQSKNFFISPLLCRHKHCDLSLRFKIYSWQTDRREAKFLASANQMQSVCGLRCCFSSPLFNNLVASHDISCKMSRSRSRDCQMFLAPEKQSVL